MKARFFACCFAAVAALSAPARADGAALAQEKACGSCHQTEVRLVGPSFQEIAAKYAGDDSARAALAQKIKQGGVGVWGQIPMPPNPHVSDEEIAALVDWILSL